MVHGCATDSEGEGEVLQVLRCTLAGCARQANFAAVIVVGLGCKTNQIQGLMAQEGLRKGAQLITSSIQHAAAPSKAWCAVSRW